MSPNIGKERWFSMENYINYILLGLIFVWFDTILSAIFVNGKNKLVLYLLFVSMEDQTNKQTFALILIN